MPGGRRPTDSCATCVWCRRARRSTIPPRATPPPILLFHPAGGNTSAYEALLKRLPEDQPVIGFDRGVEGTIEDRVREYIPRLRELQPHGPYVLVGWSFGGALAYGVAQVLREAGEDVAFVGLIDVVRPPREDMTETPPDTKRARLERWKDFAIRNYDLDRMCLSRWSGSSRRTTRDSSRSSWR